MIAVVGSMLLNAVLIQQPSPNIDTTMACGSDRPANMRKVRARSALRLKRRTKTKSRLLCLVVTVGG